MLVEDDEQRAKVDGAALAHVISFAELDELRARGRAYAAEHPTALDERADSIDEDDLFTFIYTSGTTGPPKACMIRHRNYYAMVQKGDEMDDRLTEPGRRDAPLPPARPQLRAAAASLRGVHRVHDRVPARPTARGDRAAACATDALPECAACLREDPHGGRRPSSTRRPACKRKLIDWALVCRQSGVDATTGEATRAAWTGSAPPARRQARLLEGEGAARRQAARRECRRRAALARDRGVLPRDRHPDPRGVRPLRGDDRCDREPRGGLQVRHGRQAPARASRSGSPRTARSCFGRTRSSPATTTTRRRPGRRSTTKASCTPATSAISTTTATS